MALLAVKQMRSHFDQAECCSLSKSKCCCCDIAFDGNRRVAVAWCVVVVEDMFDKSSNVTREDMGNYRTS